MPAGQKQKWCESAVREPSLSSAAGMVITSVKASPGSRSHKWRQLRGSEAVGLRTVDMRWDL